jgi:hypothetical protein
VPDLLNLQAGVAYTGNRPDMDSQAYKDQPQRSLQKRPTGLAVQD